MLTHAHLKEVGLKVEELKKKSKKEEIKSITKSWDSKTWIEEVKKLNLYYQWKEQIAEEEFLDNKPSSIIKYKARANCLPLNDRKRHIGRVRLVRCVLKKLKT